MKQWFYAALLRGLLDESRLCWNAFIFECSLTIWVKMKACLLIKTEPGRHNDVAKAVSEMEGVKLAFPVLGRTDVVANVEVTDLKALSRLVLKLLEVKGVAASETLVEAEV